MSAKTKQLSETSFRKPLSPYVAKLVGIYQELGQRNRVLLIDDSVSIASNSPDIFERVSGDRCCVVFSHHELLFYLIMNCCFISS